jgi:hypothetical protein
MSGLGDRQGRIQSDDLARHLNTEAVGLSYGWVLSQTGRQSEGVNSEVRWSN